VTAEIRGELVTAETLARSGDCLSRHGGERIRVRVRRERRRIAGTQTLLQERRTRILRSGEEKKFPRGLMAPCACRKIPRDGMRGGLTIEKSSGRHGRNSAVRENNRKVARTFVHSFEKGFFGEGMRTRGCPLIKSAGRIHFEKRDEHSKAHSIFQGRHNILRTTNRNVKKKIKKGERSQGGPSPNTERLPSSAGHIRAGEREEKVKRTLERRPQSVRRDHPLKGDFKSRATWGLLKRSPFRENIRRKWREEVARREYFHLKNRNEERLKRMERNQGGGGIYIMKEKNFPLKLSPRESSRKRKSSKRGTKESPSHRIFALEAKGGEEKMWMPVSQE